MENTTIHDIFEILGYEKRPDPNSGDMERNGLEIEGIYYIKDCGNGVLPISSGPIHALHNTLINLLGREISTPTEQVRVRCIGALGLILRRHGRQTSSELQEISSWLFYIAISSNDLEKLVSQRVGFVLENDRIIQVTK